MRIDWKTLKKFVVDTGLEHFINYLDMTNESYIWISYQNENFSCLLFKDTAEYEDFKNNFKEKAILKDDITSDGFKYSQTVFVGQQKMLRALFTTFTTSVCETNDDTGLITMQLRDENYQVTETSSEAVYSEINFNPGKDYGLYGGGIETMESISGNFVGYGILAPEIPEEYGGKLYFIRNRIMDTPREKFFRNAINVGSISVDPLDAGTLRIGLKHEKGVRNLFQTEIQYYI